MNEKETTKWVDSEEQTAKETAENATKTGLPKTNLEGQQSIFSYLERIAIAIEEGNKITRDAVTAMEKLAFDVKVGEIKKTVERKVEKEKSKSSVPTPAPTPIPKQPQKAESPKSTKPYTNAIQTVKNAFTTELADLLNFEEEDDYIILKTKKFLESDNFAKIAAIVRNIGGEYISAGKNTHFRIRKTA